MLLTHARHHVHLNEITRTRIASTNTDFEYDGVAGASNGNLVNDGVRTYEWDALNRLVRVYKTPSSPVLIGTYTYDALGRRIRKVVTNGGLSGTISNGTTDFLYNTQWQCVEERNGSDVMTRQYVWGLYIDELVYMNLQNAQGPSMSNGHKFPVQDLLYRTAAVFPDDDLVPDEVYDYDAYGNTLIFNAPGTASNWWANNATQTKVPNCEALFTGQHYDPESEIYLYRHRMYAPTHGRFLSRDPLRMEEAGPNIFAYVLSSPATLVDPLGLGPGWPRTCGEVLGKPRINYARELANHLRKKIGQFMRNPFPDAGHFNVIKIECRLLRQMLDLIAKCHGPRDNDSQAALNAALEVFNVVAALCDDLVPPQLVDRNPTPDPLPLPDSIPVIETLPLERVPVQTDHPDFRPLLVASGVALIVATLAEDIATLGVGAIDDPLTLTAGGAMISVGMGR